VSLSNPGLDNNNYLSMGSRAADMRPVTNEEDYDDFDEDIDDMDINEHGNNELWFQDCDEE